MGLTLFSIIMFLSQYSPQFLLGSGAILEAALERQGWAHFFLLQLYQCTSTLIYAPAV